MPNMMAALPNVGGALCSTPQSLAVAHYQSNVQTRKPLKFAGVPQTPESIPAASGPKFAILWGHVEDILLLNKYFSIVDTCLSCEDSARQLCDGAQMAIFCVVFASCISSEPCAAHFRPPFYIHTKATPHVEVW